jgi:paraquat-inducible protein A
MTPSALRECFGCGQFQIVPELDSGMRARCVRCDTTLRRSCNNTIVRALALNLAAAVLFAVVWTGMLMKVSTMGIVHETTLTSGPIELVRQGLWPVAVVVGFTTALAPLAKFACMIYALGALRFDLALPRLPQVFRFGRAIGIWAMLEVLLLGVFVAYTKLGDLVSINVGPAVFALGGLTVIVIWADLALDSHAVWEEFERRGWTFEPIPAPVANATVDFHPGAIGCEGCGRVDIPTGEPHDHEHDHRHCPRCGSALHARKPDSLNRTWAFIIAGAIFYIPANYYPVLTVIQAGAGQPSTIMGGVEELVDSRMYPLALLVFFASILVPVFKLIGLAVMLMATMLMTTEFGASFLLPQRTRLYYVVAWIGRWSMVDIFMESLLGALVQFGTLVTIAPGIGAVAFCAVVLLTIFAAEYFDPRLMWDAAGRNPHRSETPLRQWRFRRGRASAS